MVKPDWSRFRNPFDSFLIISHNPPQYSPNNQPEKDPRSPKVWCENNPYRTAQLFFSTLVKWSKKAGCFKGWTMRSWHGWWNHSAIKLVTPLKFNVAFEKRQLEDWPSCWGLTIFSGFMLKFQRVVLGHLVATQHPGFWSLTLHVHNF